MSFNEKEYAAKYYIDHKPLIKERVRKWKTENKIQTKKYMDNYYMKNKTRLGKCAKSYQKNYLLNPEVKERRYYMQIFKMYGLSKEAYKELLLKQDKRCAICGNETKLFVDHNHASGNVRGLLCHQCNIGLGCFKDNTKFLKNATNYLLIGELVC